MAAHRTSSGRSFIWQLITNVSNVVTVIIVSDDFTVTNDTKLPNLLRSSLVTEQKSLSSQERQICANKAKKKGNQWSMRDTASCRQNIISTGDHWHETV